MNKKLFYVFFLFILFFINLTEVSAVTCSDINKEITNYNAVEKKLSNLDCSKDTDSKLVKTCNNLNLKKSSIISNLYRMKQQNSTCKSAIKEVNIIINENKDRCTKISDGIIEGFVDKFLLVMYISAPILVILFTSLDYTKSVMSNDPQSLRKTSSRFVKRVFATILVYTMPSLVNLIIGLNNSDYLLNGDGYSCKSDFIILKKTYSIAYVPKESSADTQDNAFGSHSGGGTSFSGSGSYLNWKQCGSSWSNKMLGNSSSSVCKSGCLTTAVAIQMANSNTLKSPSSFNPGVLVNTLNSHGGYSGANFTWNGWQTLAPNFKLYNSSASISGTKNQKAKQLATYINRKYYPVVEVKQCIGRQHWVAVIAVKGTKVIMADPASNSTDLSYYSCFSNSGTQRVALFEVK